MTFENLIQTLKNKNNNFDLIRLIAAILVFYSHSYALRGVHEPSLFLGDLNHFEINLGTFGVTIFFVISGFLITFSFQQSSNLTFFLKKRFARIFPAIWFNYLFTIFILGPLVTKHSLNNYFSELLELIPTILFHSFGIVEFKLDPLPGVFQDNIIQNTVNGQLWTLRPELICYLVIAILGLIKILKKETFFLMPVALISILVFFQTNSFFSLILLHITSFMIGAAYFIYFNKIKLNGYFFLLSVLTLGLQINFNFHCIPLYIFTSSYLVLYLCLQKNIFSISKILGDISYGIYLYSWPILQTFSYLFITNNKSIELYYLFSAASVFLLASFSWFFIEKPVLVWGRRRT